MKKNTFLIAALLLTSAVTQALILKPVDGKTEFFAVGRPGMIKINGEGLAPEGELTIINNLVSGSLTVDMTKLTTKIDLRDEHMKNKYLEVSKYPKAILTFKDLKLPAELSTFKKETTLPFNGDFTLHGKTNPVSGEMIFSVDKKIVSVNAVFDVKIIDYLENLPEWLGMKVAETVKIKTVFNGTTR